MQNNVWCNINLYIYIIYISLLFIIKNILTIVAFNRHWLLRTDTNSCWSYVTKFFSNLIVESMQPYKKHWQKEVPLDVKQLQVR